MVEVGWEYDEGRASKIQRVVHDLSVEGGLQASIVLETFNCQKSCQFFEGIPVWCTII